MPSVSKKQHKFFEAIAHSPEFARKVGVPQSVGKEFVAADKARRSKIGGALEVAKRASGGAISQTPWFTRHAAERELRNPSMPKVAPPVIPAPTGFASTPLGKAMGATAKVSAPKVQFPKLPSAPKPPKIKLKSGGEVGKRTEPPSHGPLLGSTPGRADSINTQVEDGSYIIPADVCSSAALGQNNTLAGFAKLEQLFPNSKQTSAATKKQGGTVDCALSDGEFRVSRKDCLKVGGGDLDKGHRILDHLVMRIRHHNIQSLQKLPVPADSDE